VAEGLGAGNVGLVEYCNIFDGMVSKLCSAAAWLSSALRTDFGKEKK
jgi:hypothetical protein